MQRKFKGLIAISDVLDDRYQKLCDRYHELELSHNRKKRALNRLLVYFEYFEKECVAVNFETDGPMFQNFIQICRNALFCDGRQNTKIFSYSKAWDYYKDRNPYTTWLKEQACITRKKDSKNSCETSSLKKAKK